MRRNPLARLRTATLVVTCALLSVGFADCHFAALQAEYKLKACPPQDFAWPKEAKNETMEITEEPLKNWEMECKKLIRYQVRRKLDHHGLFTNTGWATFDVYLGVVKDESCSLILFSPSSGPPVSKARQNEAAGKWADDDYGVLRLLMKGGPLSVQIPAVKTATTDDKDDYRKWCDALQPADLGK